MVSKLMFRLSLICIICSSMPMISALPEIENWRTGLRYPKAAYVHQGHQAFLNCHHGFKGEGYNAKYIWKDGHNTSVTDSRMKVLHSGRLSISDVQPRDQGPYTCVIKQPGKPDMIYHHRLFVYKYPVYRQEAMLVYKPIKYECTSSLAETKLLYFQRQLCNYRLHCVYSVSSHCMHVKDQMKLVVTVKVKTAASFENPECNPLCIKESVIANLETSFAKILKLAESEENETKSSENIQFDVKTGFIKATRITCASGYSSEAKLLCLPCPPGTSASRGSNHCELCPVNTFQSFFAQRKCFPCPNNGTTEQRGVKSSAECIAPDEVKLHLPGVTVDIESSGQKLLKVTIAAILVLVAVVIILAIVRTMNCQKNPDIPPFLPDPITEYFMTRAASQHSLHKQEGNNSVTGLSDNTTIHPPSTALTSPSAADKAFMTSLPPNVNKNRSRTKSSGSSGRSCRNQQISSHSSLWDDYSAMEREGMRSKRHSSIRVDDWVESVKTDSANFIVRNNEQFPSHQEAGFSRLENTEEPIYMNMNALETGDEPVYMNVGRVGEHIEEPVYENIPLMHDRKYTGRYGIEHAGPSHVQDNTNQSYHDSYDDMYLYTDIPTHSYDADRTSCTDTDHLYDSVAQSTATGYMSMQRDKLSESDCATYKVDSPSDLPNVPNIAEFPSKNKYSAYGAALQLKRKTPKFSDKERKSHRPSLLNKTKQDKVDIPVAPPPPPVPPPPLPPVLHHPVQVPFVQPQKTWCHVEPPSGNQLHKSDTPPSESKDTDTSIHPAKKTERVKPKPPPKPTHLKKGINQEIKTLFQGKTNTDEGSSCLSDNVLNSNNISAEGKSSFRELLLDKDMKDAHSSAFKTKQNLIHEFVGKTIAVHKAKGKFLTFAKSKTGQKRQDTEEREPLLVENNGSAIVKTVSNNSSHNSLNKRVSACSAASQSDDWH